MLLCIYVQIWPPIFHNLCKFDWFQCIVYAKCCWFHGDCITRFSAPMFVHFSTLFCFFLYIYIYIYLVDSNVYSPYSCFHLNVRTFLCLTHICMYLYMYIRSKNSWRARIIKWLCSKRVLVKVPNLFHVLWFYACSTVWKPMAKATKLFV